MIQYIFLSVDNIEVNHLENKIMSFSGGHQRQILLTKAFYIKALATNLFKSDMYIKHENISKYFMNTNEQK